MELKFVQLGQSEIKQDAIVDFNFASNCNQIALLGSCSEVVILQLMHNTDISTTFPYKISYLRVPQTRPCAKLIDAIDLSRVYGNCSVLESQELALDPMYVADYSIDPPKAKVLQLDWSLAGPMNKEPILAYCTSYGLCEVKRKAESSRHWREDVCNISEILLTKIFPVKGSIPRIETFPQLKAYIEVYWITALVWHRVKGDSPPILVVGNAAGWILTLEFGRDFQEVKESSKLQTSLGRIVYIKSFDKFLLVSDVRGVVQLFEVSTTSPRTLRSLEQLWKGQDRITCHRAVSMFSSKYQMHFLVFAKMAHFLAFGLNVRGEILCQARSSTTGIKITGIESLNEEEFIVTTLTGTVQCVRLSCTTDGALEIHTDSLQTEVDATNLQILDVTATRYKNIWCFMLYRNKEYAPQSKYHHHSAFVSVCKLNSVDALASLSRLEVKTMDEYLDYAIAINLDILNNYSTEKYNDFYDLSNAKYPKEIHEPFLQHLQKKLLIVKSFANFQRIKLKNVKRQTAFELEFLKLCIPLTHILCRLGFLGRMKSAAEWSPFQKLAAQCMTTKFQLLQKELHALVEAENPLNNSIERFIKIAAEEMKFKCFNDDFNSSENCLDCGEEVKKDTMMCSQEHRVPRCCVSFLQVSLFNKRYCVHCKSFAREDDSELKQLFDTDEVITCPFCRFSFVNTSF